LRALDALLEGRTGSWVINLFFIPAMIFLALVLPPLALPQRVLSAGYTGINAKSGGSVPVEDGTFFSIPAGALRSDANIKLNYVKRDAFLKSAAAQDLPPTLEVKSPAYQPSLQGQPPALAILSIPIPDDAEPITTLDVYGYDGKKWYKLAFQPYEDDYRIEAYILGTLPQHVVIVQTQAQAPTISADLTVKAPLPTQAAPLLAEVNPVGLTLVLDGGISGNVPTLPEAGASSPYQVLPTINNLSGSQVRGDLVEDMILNSEIRSQHVQALVDLAVEKLYPGLNIDYQGVTEDNRSHFSAFVSELAQALRAKNKILSVTLPLPTQKSADTWQTGAYDWDTIGQAADVVRIPMPTTREAYAGDSPAVRAYLQWAVGRIDRYKLQPTFSVMGRDEFGGSFAPIGFATATKLMGPIEAPTLMIPEGKVFLDLPKLRETGGVKFDAASGLYSFTYNDDKGQPHSVWLENATSIAKKVALAQEYNLRGVALRDLSSDAVEPRVWDVLKQYRESQTPSAPGNLIVAWRVNGQVVGRSAATSPGLNWNVPGQQGEAKIEAAISFDDGRSTAGTIASAASEIRKLVVPTPVPTPAPAVAAPPTPRPAAPVTSAFAGQNLFAYGAQLNWTNRDGLDDLKRMGFTWAKIQVRWCDFESRKGSADLSQLDRFVGAANSRGIKVMFSVVCAPNWSRRDGGAGGSGPPDNMQDAADFMGGLAGLFCNRGLGAIEVWNEHNLLTEWHGKPISAAMYVEMLRLSHAKIKAACPSIVVISGAPTPTGVMSETAIDDVVFLRQMYQNGLKQYSDAIGAHPSGFCNAPEAVEGSPNACGGQYNNHRSFFFRRTMESYRQVMVENGDANKQVWPTEFGWGVDPNPKPGYEYERFISDGMQAEWLVKAYQMMKSWGWVGVSILWNLDFMDMNNETGAFHVVGRPAFDRLAGMPK
jgi:hypothetical protein